MQTILFIYKGYFSYLPPFQALVDTLLESGQYKLKIICSEDEPDMDEKYKHPNLEFIHYYSIEPRTSIVKKLRNRFKSTYVFKKRVKHDLNTLDYDILWVIHERTAIGMRNILRGRKYILTSYELRAYDEPELMQPLVEPMRNAVVNVQCEYNRSWIARMIYGLKDTPITLPNKPYRHPEKRNLENELLKNDGRKIILYQGVLTRERNLDGMCSAISKLDGFKLVLMGKPTEYLHELQQKYDCVEYLGFVKSPGHLMITSNAYIGLVTYEPENLDTIYCAPNKIWEYSGFGIPMIANQIPGLEYTIGMFNAGVCTDTDNIDCIRDAIAKIDSNYISFCENSYNLYKSCDTRKIVNEIIRQYQIK